MNTTEISVRFAILLKLWNNDKMPSLEQINQSVEAFQMWSINRVVMRQFGTTFDAFGNYTDEDYEGTLPQDRVGPSATFEESDYSIYNPRFLPDTTLPCIRTRIMPFMGSSESISRNPKFQQRGLLRFAVKPKPLEDWDKAESKVADSLSEWDGKKVLNLKIEMTVHPDHYDWELNYT